jgi:spore coat polysaccharide biosynthesis predicted glycosyltransferase SpsG
MAELMEAADLSIGAGGSTLWERCCLGLPTLAVSIAENQRLLIIDAAEAGLLYAPTNNTDVASLISRHLAALLENSALLKLISRADIQTVDGKGVIRAVNAMKITEITIRRATELDAQQISASQIAQTLHDMEIDIAVHLAG